jgi:protein-tyrosine-phosphatase
MKRNLFILLLLSQVFLCFNLEAQNEHAKVLPELYSYIEESIDLFNSISPERKERLVEIAQYLKNDNNSPKIELTFICTHNSRRSHLSQVWAQTAAEWYVLKNVQTYSGGTESTAFNPRAVAALSRAGFLIDKGEGENPKYSVAFGSEVEPMICFSKKYDHPENPQKGFIAIMTCSDADRNCPVVSGSSARFSIPYIDPKVSDGTTEEAATYDERCRQISVEMLYLMSKTAE